jgi:hypothetical protein
MTQDTNTEITPIPYMIDLSPYDVNNNVPLININNGNENDKRTMTQEEYTISEAAGAENKAIIDSITSVVTAPIKAITTGASSIVNGILDRIPISYKAIVPLVGITVVLIGAYYALNIVATTKKNIKTLKE